MRRPFPATVVSASRGFTLIELLVAIGVLAVIAVLGWRALDSITRSRDVLTSELEQLKVHQITFVQMQIDCAQLVNADVVPAMETLKVDADKLVLIRYMYPENRAAELQVVSYRIRDGALVRAASTATRDKLALQAEWNNALAGSNAAAEVVLEPHVEAINFRTWNNGESAWRQAGFTDSAAHAPLAARHRNSGRPLPHITGIEVSLSTGQQANPMLRVFFMGAV